MTSDIVNAIQDPVVHENAHIDGVWKGATVLGGMYIVLYTNVYPMYNFIISVCMINNTHTHIYIYIYIIVDLYEIIKYALKLEIEITPINEVFPRVVSILQ